MVGTLTIGVLSLALAVPALAQDSAPAAPIPPASACAEARSAGRAGTCIPALTLVTLELRDAVSSRTSQTGDRFRIAVAYPVGDPANPLIPAGIEGEGEVVHAKKTGVGVGGELVLAARFLMLGQHRIRLRSMQLVGEGQDQQALAFAVGVAVGLPALFIRGKHIDVPAGTNARAKTAEDVWIDLPPTPPAEPAPAPVTHAATPAAAPAPQALQQGSTTP